MGISEFNKLDPNQKQELVKKHGQYIAIATEGQYNYLLYSLFGFFAETMYDKQHNRIEDIIAFPKGQPRLDKYIDTENRLKSIVKGAQ